MSRIIIIENSGKVNFGGGQKITLQVAEILSKTCELVFVDFAKGTRFEQMINEKFPDSSKVLLKGRSFFFPFKYLNWLLDLVVLTCLFPGNLRKIKYYVTKKTLIYVTTKKGLLYAYMMKVMYGVPFIYHAHLVENTKSIFYFLYRSCLKKLRCLYVFQKQYMIPLNYRIKFCCTTLILMIKVLKVVKIKTNL